MKKQWSFLPTCQTVYKFTTKAKRKKNQRTQHRLKYLNYIPSAKENLQNRKKTLFSNFLFLSVETRKQEKNNQAKTKWFSYIYKFSQHRKRCRFPHFNSVFDPSVFAACFCICVKYSNTYQQHSHVFAAKKEKYKK